MANSRTLDQSNPFDMRAADLASSVLSETSSGKKTTTPRAPATSQAEYVYTCPSCKGVVTSFVATGQINHRRICGKQFRVENGFVRPTQRYVHTCPTCGSCIHSTKKQDASEASTSKQTVARALKQNGNLDRSEPVCRNLLSATFSSGRGNTMAVKDGEGAKKAAKKCLT